MLEKKLKTDRIEKDEKERIVIEIVAVPSMFSKEMEKDDSTAGFLILLVAFSFIIVELYVSLKMR